MKMTVDKIEANIIVAELETGAMCELPKIACPDAKEGDIIEVKILPEETSGRKKLIEDKMNNLFI